MGAKEINKVLNLYYIFTLFIIITIRYETVYLSTILATILILIMKIYNFKNKLKNKNKNIKITKTIINIYVVYSFIHCLLINNTEIIYVINKIIPFLFFNQMLDYIIAIDIEERTQYITKLLIYGVILSIVLFICDISYIELGGNTRIISITDMLARHNEYRLSGFLSHKSRFGIYIVISAMCILTYKINNKKKIILILLCILAIYLSSSMTNLLGIILLLFMYYIYKYIYNTSRDNRELRLKKIAFTIFGVLSIIIIGNVLIQVINSIFNRDISTLGARTDIWKYAVDYIKFNPRGIVRLHNNFYLDSALTFTNAHNLFLNEFIESGMLGGILFISIYISAMFCIKDDFIKSTFFILLFIAQFDKIISNEVTYIFWSIFAIYMKKSETRIMERR